MTYSGALPTHPGKPRLQLGERGVQLLFIQVEVQCPRHLSRGLAAYVDQLPVHNQ